MNRFSPRRAVERSLMQVQTLVDSLTANPLRSPDRAAYLSCSRVPPFWQLETELCRLYQSLGSHKAALDIALRLKQWEVVIECYHLLQVISRLCLLILKLWGISVAIKF